MKASFTVNDTQVKISLQNFASRITPAPMLQIGAQVMRSSFERTFREQGSPSGSWPPLAAATRKKGKGGKGRKMLIQSGRLKNSNTYDVQGKVLLIGSNLVYSRIQQEGGYAGRRSPSSRRLEREKRLETRGFHGPRNQHGFLRFSRPFIPARPYLVFRPEDPQRIAAGMERYANAAAKQEGL